MPPDDTPDTDLIDPAGRTAGGDAHVPERRCILSGERRPRAEMIRLVLAPDGQVLPDLRARAPGRGAWIGVGKAALETAMAKGKLKGALARAFRSNAVSVPADLAGRIDEGLARALLDRLGLEARAGTLLNGSERIVEAARAGRVHLLLHAADAAENGTGRLDQAWRAGGAEPGSRGVALPFDRPILSVALGRENVVSVAIVDGGAAARVRALLDRWRAYIGRDGGSAPGEASPGPPG